MPLPSNILQSLPDYFNEEDKLNYELLTADAKRYFPYMNEYIIHIGVLAHINKELGRGEELNEEEAKELMEKYNDGTIEYTTPFDPDFDFKTTMKEIIEPSGRSRPTEAIEPNGRDEPQKKSIDNIEEDDEINETDGECTCLS
jgi:hypothetical protein